MNRLSPRLPRSIVALGFVSMLMDVSSELIHGLLPIFMTTTLGASMMTVGFVEGIAEGTAAITKVFSGAVSDYFRRRKMLAVFGYAIAAATKPIFPLATSIGWVFGARFADRIGKGIRGAPRDALVAELAPAGLRGAAFGLRQALDSVGAFLGPLLAILFMIRFAGDIPSVLWMAVPPAFLSVALLLFGVKEPESAPHSTGRRLVFSDLRRLTGSYWRIALLGAVFTLARFSEAFLILRAREAGLAIAYAPAVMIVMNVFYSLIAYPAGSAADRISRRTLLLYGLTLLIVADLLLAFSSGVWVVLLGAALWGGHMAMTQGLLLKLVADTSPSELFGTAFGVFNLVSGVALLLASAIAGTLWSAYGSMAAFLAGASFALLAALGLFTSGAEA